MAMLMVIEEHEYGVSGHIINYKVPAPQIFIKNVTNIATINA